jgi:uncharacterized protein YyaL (SSP411 family)
MPAFSELLQRVARYYRDQPGEIRKQNVALAEAFESLYPPLPGASQVMTDAPLKKARTLFEDEFDGRHGGFGAAPKFPHSPTIERLLRHWQASAGDAEPDLQALYMATLTLKRMAEGGLNDQLGGGFSRYSVDQYWMIPHFEKMLYDNGPLLALYAQAAIATGDAFFARVAAETAAWVLREMQSPEGGFFSSLDADSEGHEGRFYVWDKAEIAGVLTPDEYRLFERRFGLDHPPNFESRHWHLHAYESIEKIATREHRSPGDMQAALDRARAKLFAVREKRVRPGRDEKILTSWNALMIRGLAIAGRALAEPRLTEAALAGADFLRANAWREGRLYAACKDGVARFPAYLDDHAFLLDALLELLQTRFRMDDLAFAREIADSLLRKFADRERGGFWFTADGKDPPMARPKSFVDDATPSGNGIAAQALARLGWLTGETRYLDAAEAAVRAGYASLARAPEAHAALLNALDEYLEPVEIVVMRGDAAGVAAWQAALAREYAPRRMVIAIPADAAGLPEALAAKKPGERTVAYVCRGPVCSEPVAELESLKTRS